jgi:hypothetical protein
VQKCSEILGGEPLFESILVFENYPLDQSLKDLEAKNIVSDVYSIELTNYPLGLTAALNPELVLEIKFDSERFERATIRRVLPELEMILKGFVTHRSMKIEDLHQMLDESTRQMNKQREDEYKTAKQRRLKEINPKPIAAAEK